MAKKDKKKKKKSTAIVPYNPDKMTYEKATSWGKSFIPKRVQKIKEVVKRVGTKISEARKASAAAKAEKNRVTTIYTPEKGATKLETKTSPQYTKTTEATKTKKKTTEGAYKEGSAVRKAQKETLSKVKTGTSKKTAKTTHRPGRTPVTTVKPLDKWAKQIEEIRNSNMSITQKKNAINEVNKQKASANIRATGQEKRTEHLKTPEGQKDFQQSRQKKMDIGKQRKARKKDEDEVKKYISHLNKR